MNLLDHFHPVLHYFFIEHFPSMEQWYSNSFKEEERIGLPTEITTSTQQVCIQFMAIYWVLEIVI